MEGENNNERGKDLEDKASMDDMPNCLMVVLRDGFDYSSTSFFGLFGVWILNVGPITWPRLV